MKHRGKNRFIECNRVMLVLVAAIVNITIGHAIASPIYTSVQITNNLYDDKYPQINNDGYVVWEGSDALSIIHISYHTRLLRRSRIPSSS